jgi:uncharacterized protein (DUF1778 family)
MITSNREKGITHMAAPTTTRVSERRTEKLDVRVTPTVKAILKAAAAVSRRNVSDFVLESAMAQADETLADRRAFNLNAEQWAQFQAALDAPPRERPRLQKLLTKPGYFDSGSQK